MNTRVAMKTTVATFIRGAMAAAACLLLWLAACTDTRLQAGPRKSVSPSATTANPMDIHTP